MSVDMMYSPAFLKRFSEEQVEEMTLHARGRAGSKAWTDQAMFIMEEGVEVALIAKMDDGSLFFCLPEELAGAGEEAT